MGPMHDWTLHQMSFDWQKGELKIEVGRWPQITEEIICSGLQTINLSRTHPWGPSVFINELVSLEQLATGHERLLLEMQSGDQIEIVASKINLPEAALHKDP